MSYLKSLRYKFVISAVVGEKENEDYLKMANQRWESLILNFSYS